MHRAEEYQAAYARTTESRHVKIWGGADAVLDGEWKTPYNFISEAGYTHIFEDGTAHGTRHTAPLLLLPPLLLLLTHPLAFR